MLQNKPNPPTNYIKVRVFPYGAIFPGGGRWDGGGPCPEILPPMLSSPLRGVMSGAQNMFSRPMSGAYGSKACLPNPFLELMGPKHVFRTHFWGLWVQNMFSGPLGLMGPKHVFRTHFWGLWVQSMFSGPMSGAYGSKVCFPDPCLELMGPKFVFRTHFRVHVRSLWVQSKLTGYK